jgi:photosystem II stability/assembly factor-like uncharacterized protein
VGQWCQWDRSPYDGRRRELAFMRIPKGEEKFDLVSVQGSDENTAVAISTGKGSLSGIYKTADGCQTWRRVFSNPDASGSFKSIHRITNRQLYLLGDPVDGKFSMFYSADGGET